jgi:ATP-dependent Lon protease
VDTTPNRNGTETAAERPDTLAVLPLRDTVVFPEAVVPVLVGKDRSKALVRSLVQNDEPLVALTLTTAAAEEPGADQLAEIGTMARIVQLFEFPDGNYRLVVKGVSRIRLGPYSRSHPFLEAEVEHLSEVVTAGARREALQRQVTEAFRSLVERTPYLADQAAEVAGSLGDPSHLTDFVAASLNLDAETRQSLLETLDVEDRLERLVRITAQELEIIELGSRIQEQVASELQQNQREVLLRKQMEAIRRELGEQDEVAAEVDELRGRLDGAGLPEEARKEADRELQRLERLPAASQEYHVIRNYLDWMVRFPWSEVTEDHLEVAAARKILDDDHHGLDKVKERILEYLAVRSLKEDMRGPILLFVGAPGVGKTSLGRSIARSLGREFVRMSLGGVRDEAEIRGHRRTYVGALPGRIVQGLARAGTRNPVFMLDEVDKIGADYRGDPAAALLEVLDPEQNHDFRDHYLDVPIDLSQVLFIATANVVHTIPAPLLDRMEVVELPGYTVDEKVAIATKHLVAKQLDAHGLDEDMVSFDEAALETIASAYTREAGVRGMDRKVATVIRKAARMIVEGEAETVRITTATVGDMLGPEPFRVKSAERADEVGVVAGLAVTPVGGDVLFVETSLVPGSGKVTTTGQLGDVMRESAQAATTYVRSRAEGLGLDPKWIEAIDVHIHVPEGAVPKDGPSAGVTLATALVSASTGRPVRHDVAMTGEVTLRGKVLPIGGIREKVVAAHRAGIRTVVIPAENEKDLHDVPPEVRGDMDIHLVAHMDEVLEVALASADRAATVAETP